MRQMSHPASTVPASSTAVGRFRNTHGFEEDLTAPDLYQSASHSVQDMDEQQSGSSVTGTTVLAVSGELRRMRRGHSSTRTALPSWT